MAQRAAGTWRGRTELHRRRVDRARVHGGTTAENNALIHGDSYHIAVEGHIGTWYAIDETEIGGEKFFLLEHEEHGDMAACVAVKEQGKLVAEDLWNGFDEDFQEAVQKYL